MKDTLEIPQQASSVTVSKNGGCAIYIQLNYIKGMNCENFANSFIPINCDE